MPMGPNPILGQLEQTPPTFRRRHCSDCLSGTRDELFLTQKKSIVSVGFRENLFSGDKSSSVGVSGIPKIKPVGAPSTAHRNFLQKTGPDFIPITIPGPRL